MASSGKQFTVIITREMLTAVARDQGRPDVVAGILARFSKFAFVLFCHIPNHLMSGPLGNSEFLSLESRRFPWLRGNIEILGKQSHCSPRDQSLSVNYNQPLSSRVSPVCQQYSTR